MFYEELFKKLNKGRVDYVVVGGVALVLHGVVRLTADLDLAVHLGTDNLSRFIRIMDELGYRPKAPVRAENLMDPRMRETWIKEKNMKVFSFYHPKEAISLVDVFVDEPVPYRELKTRAVKMKAGNIGIPVASIEDLIRLKRISDRPQDRVDIEALKEVKKHGNR